MGKCILAGHSPVGSIGCGTYTGDGAASRTISLGVTPKWVILAAYGTMVGYWGSIVSGALAVEGSDATAGSGTACKIVADGFSVAYDSTNHILTNNSTTKYNYLYGV